MEHDLVLEGKVVRPTGVEEMEVGISEGKVAELRKQGVRGARRIRAGRCLVFPGFIDIHVHLREPGWEHKEDFRTGTEAAIHGGVTTLVDMPNNLVPASTVPALEEKIRLAGVKALVDVKFYGGVLEDRLDDLERVSGLVVGYKIYLARSTGDVPFPENELGEAFRRIEKLSLPVSLHCEDRSVIERKARELAGVNRQDIYCDIRPPEAEVQSVRKVVAALEGAKGLRANVCHASTRGTLKAVAEAKREGLSIDCEAALHHLYFNRRAMLQDRRLRMNPPLRSEEDREALVLGLNRGTVSFLVTDHAPHTREEKSSEDLSGVPGLDDFAHIVSWLIRKQGVDPVVIGRVASSNPAEYAALQDRGEVSIGKVADFAILDLSSAETVKSDSVRSKCGWSPYEGREFPGRTRWTVKGGETLLDDFEPVT